jgi:hypothetical protein
MGQCISALFLRCSILFESLILYCVRILPSTLRRSDCADRDVRACECVYSTGVQYSVRTVSVYVVQCISCRIDE